MVWDTCLREGDFRVIRFRVAQRCVCVCVLVNNEVETTEKKWFYSLWINYRAAVRWLKRCYLSGANCA